MHQKTEELVNEIARLKIENNQLQEQISAINASRNKDEVALRQNNEQLEQIVIERTNEIVSLSVLNKAIVENASVAVVSTSKDGMINSFNHSAEVMLGYNASEIIGVVSPFVFFDYSDVLARAHENGIKIKHDTFPEFETYARLIVEKIPHAYEGSLVRKDGVKIPVLMSVSQLEDNEGQIIGYVTIAADISERKRAESALKMQSAAFESFALAIIITDCNGVITWANSAFTGLSGYSRQEAIGKTTGLLVKSGKQDQEFYKILWDTILSGKVWSGELINSRKNGTLYPEELTITPVFGHEGTITSFIAIKIDISKRKKIEQSLIEGLEREKELNELKSKFVSVASHEFRTPLATILATSETLMAYMDKMSREQQKKRVEKIKDQVTNLTKIIEDMLFLTKLQAREVALKPESFNLADFFREIVEDFRNRKSIGNRLILHMTLNSMQVFLDKKQIHQILTNLLTNAFKYSGSTTYVILSLAHHNQEIEFTVEDEGIGIPEEDLKFIFKPFYRASNAGNIPGTGLGLNIVKESVDRLGGNIMIESKAGIGTKFIVTLSQVFNTVKRSSNDKNPDHRGHP